MVVRLFPLSRCLEADMKTNLKWMNPTPSQLLIFMNVTATIIQGTEISALENVNQANRQSEAERSRSRH